MKDFVGNYEIFCSFARTRNLLFTKFPILASDHYQKMGRLKDVERCLVHLDLVNLDIDQVKILRPPLFYSSKHTRDAVELRCLLMLLSTTYTGHVFKLVIRNDFTISRLHIPGIQSRPFSCAHLLNSNTCVSQTVKLCWKYELYDAVIYVYNRGMGDFGTPLEVLNVTF